MPFLCSNKKIFISLILIVVQSLLAFGIRFPNVSLGALPKNKGEREREERNRERKFDLCHFLV